MNKINFHGVNRWKMTECATTGAIITTASPEVFLSSLLYHSNMQMNAILFLKENHVVYYQFIFTFKVFKDFYYNGEVVS